MNAIALSTQASYNQLVPMQIAPGTRLGPYQIVAPIGAGGMGEVYKATDTRLERTVPIKVLAKQDEEASARLLPEARAASALNHPHLCTIHEVSERGPSLHRHGACGGNPVSQLIPSDGVPPESRDVGGVLIGDAILRVRPRERRCAFS